ncbi:hypothetical protein L3X38_025160 [Prunus dulcis]|uniref:Transposase MuDR plant domain-containing protein n=1 Tax=Prunus dulcis TaxID=3755 RepID=A0AAD4W3U7_PRUDU|nr:hypothetical protein L3X38_025160 [Prunus dulcis]
MSLCSDVCSRFDELEVGAFEITYLAADYPSCLLESDLDIGKYGAPADRAYLSHTWRNYINHVCQKFIGEVHEFRDEQCKYAIEKGFKVVYLKNEKERVIAECSKKSSDSCSSRVHATLCPANDFFNIRTLNNEHTCSGCIRDWKNMMMCSKVVSSILAEQIASKPLMKPIEIVKDFKKFYGLDISYYNAWYGMVWN